MIGQAKRASSLFFRVFLSLVATLTLVGGALAQGGSSGAISGSIKDEKGAAVTGAQVEIINAATGVTERTATSDADGNFTLPSYPQELTN